MAIGKAKGRLSLGVTSLVCAATLSGCGTGNGDQAKHGASPRPTSGGQSNGGQRPASSPIQTRVLTIHPPLRVDVLSLGRVGGQGLKLRLRFTNTSGDRLELFNLFHATQPGESDEMDSLGGITLVDGTNLKQYYPRLSTDGKCLCTNYPGAFVDGGTVFESTILYPAPPANVQKIDIAAQRMPPFTDIPIAGSAAKYPGDPDLATSAMRPPLVTSLVSTSDDLGGSKSIDDGGSSVGIRLSSDVLFKFNKATLTTRANAILKDVASRLDQASATTVTIDGYTDTTGNDGINIPLSKKRAESVKSALQQLVTRPGITYQTAGHGSQNPVASNDTAQGRQSNRRVTVSYRK
jgi:outer membrane protein OmpA-like peptidoglycan-associated protein